MKISLTGWLRHVETEEIELWFNSGRRVLLNQDSIIGIKKLWGIICKLLDMPENKSCGLPLVNALDAAVDQEIEEEDLRKILQ